MTDTSQQLLARYRNGSSNAADELFGRYMQRLTALARRKLSERIARRIDPEDIVLSAYRSFFVGARNGRFEVRRGGDLWRLLASITLHKLHREVAKQQAHKRSVQREISFGDFECLSQQEPTPEAALIAAEELEAVLRSLPVLAQRVLELRLQGESLDTIAKEVHRTERTIRRMLDLARDAFRRRGLLTDQADLLP